MPTRTPLLKACYRKARKRHVDPTEAMRECRRILADCAQRNPWKRKRCITKALDRTAAHGVSTFAGGRFVKLPAQHLRKDMREAQAMVRELTRGIKRDRKALRRGFDGPVEDEQVLNDFYESQGLLKKGRPTDLNLSVLARLFGWAWWGTAPKDERGHSRSTKATRVPNEIQPVSAPHLRRCMKAGLVKPEGKELVLTPAGEVAVRLKEHEMNERNARLALISSRGY